MLCFRASSGWAVVAACLVASVARAQTEHPAEKVRVTYEASAGCPDGDAFLAQVRARVGAAWEAPSNELARTIEVRVTGGGEKSVARIDFVDENNQPITRVVTAKTCDEVVTGIALVTALAIESRIAEAVGKSEPAQSMANEPPAALPAPEVSKIEAPPVPVVQRVHPPAEEPSPPPHYDVGGGAFASVGALPGISALGFRGVLGLGWSAGPDFRIGGDVLSTGTVKTTANGNDYESSFSLTLGRASICPIALGGSLRFLPCGGVEVGWLKAKGLTSTLPTGLNVEGGDAGAPWVAPFVSVRGDAQWEVFFVEAEVSFAFPILPTDRDFVFLRSAAGGARVEDKVHTIWPVSPGVALDVGLRL